MSKVFISYRRNDADADARSRYSELVGSFGEGAVFMDVAAIEPGHDFRKAIQDHVKNCGVLLALIGTDWLAPENGSSAIRLDDPRDYVRFETAAALKRNIPVIPLLVRGARMPSEDRLPADLKELSYRNAVELTHARWSTDIIPLKEAISRYTRMQPATRKPHRSAGSKPSKLWIVILLVIAIAIAIAVVVPH